MRRGVKRFQDLIVYIQASTPTPLNLLKFITSISKMRLRPDGGVTGQLKMRTHFVYALLFLLPCALS
jgi:hypothetical protein